ncbi:MULTISPECIES: LexA family protein [unclassified Acinetobacter]|uniref:LexA family protein n=1 Tax=unclassified Acinetobacter TaxID=196816 RepID=UPI0004D9EE3F|nr:MULTISPECIES: LexA family transcriptional regulator [unclassified Acinetobacter]KEC83270.1 repressor [Acinetobacter sp. ETR1]WEE41491.1 LexA family transcriptional regulator [Acinetobacter sp. TAC-1]
MSLKDRLKASRKNARKTQLEVAEAVKMSQPAYQALESGRNQKSSFLPLIADFLAVDPLWLTTGEGASTADKKDLSFTNVVVNESPLFKIPVLDFVQAGIFHESGYDGINPKGETYTTYRSCRPDSVFSLEVSGLSMSPEFLPGDKLVVDSAKDPYPGCYVIAQNGSHEATFKKYRAIGYDEHGRETFELIPLNPDFPTMNSIQHEIRIIGVVVEHLRSFNK